MHYLIKYFAIAFVFIVLLVPTQSVAEAKTSQLTPIKEKIKNKFKEKPTNKSNKETISLRILETTDLHGRMMNYDYQKEKWVNNYGFVKTASLIKTARSQSDNNLLFDVGDLLQGNEFAERVAQTEQLNQWLVHPIYRAMNKLGYDAATFGNHDFHFGLDFLHHSIQGAEFPYINANLYLDDHNTFDFDDMNYYKPYVILPKEMVDDKGKKHRLNVGVIGFVTPSVVLWEKESIGNIVKAKDIVASAETFVPIMKKEGADIVIALAHSGLDETVKPYKKEINAVYPLAKVKGIDAILFGHRHRVFPDASQHKNVPGIDTKNGKIFGVPSVEAGSWGDYLGIIDMELVKKKNGWKVMDARAQAKPIFKREGKKYISTVKKDADIFDVLNVDHKKTLDYLNKAD